MILPLECKGRGPHLAYMWQLIGVWCIGRTQYFGYWRTAGSNPVTPTKRRETSSTHNHVLYEIYAIRLFFNVTYLALSGGLLRACNISGECS